MKTRKVAELILIAMAIGFAIAIVGWLMGWRPRDGLEAEFQRVINEAHIADYYRGAEGGGWDREDVTEEICDRVNRATLTKMGIPLDNGISWSIPTDGSTSRPRDIWRVFQDKGAIAACRDRSIRYLDIEIDRESPACTATVGVMPNCDL